jgi:hypothetical protein
VDGCRGFGVLLHQAERQRRRSGPSGLDGGGGSLALRAGLVAATPPVWRWLIAAAPPGAWRQPTAPPPPDLGGGGGSPAGPAGAGRRGVLPPLSHSWAATSSWGGGLALACSP